MRFFTAAILILASSAMLLGAPKPPPPPLKLDQNAVLYITIIQNLDHRYGNFGESDRFYYMEHEIEKAIELTDFPMEYKVQRWSASRVPEGNPELTINLTHWGDNRMGEIEVRFFARIKEDASRRGNRKVGSGYFRERDGVFGFSSTRVQETYNRLFRKAIVDVLRELNKSFEVTFEGEEIKGEEESR